MVTSVTSGWGVDGDMMGVSLLLLDLVVAMVVLFGFVVFKNLWKAGELYRRLSHILSHH